MTVGDMANLAMAILAAVAAFGGFGAWLLGIGEKLGAIVNATAATTAALEHLNEKIEVIENHQNTLFTHISELRDDVTDLQNRVPRKG